VNRTDASAARGSAPAAVPSSSRGGGRDADVVVIGSGVGGLSAAVALAARGLKVEVLEAHQRAGGKLGIEVVDGIEVDTGPSVLTLPQVLDRTLGLAGTSLADELELLEPAPAFRYLYPDGTALDVYPDLERTLDSVARTLGHAAAAELHGFLGYARRIWEAAAGHFVFGPAPGPASLLRAGPGAPALLLRIDPLRSMWSAIQRRVRSEHLRLILARYATYNGSDVRRAPATLNCIAHVELALGGYGVRGGMYEVARALVRAAERLGVSIHYGARVERIAVEHGRACGVETTDGRRWQAAAVVANADAAHVLGDLLPPGSRKAAPRPGERSMSGWVGVLRARRREGPERRVAHTMLFPADYLAEFADIFDRCRPPGEPTAYLCAQEICHRRSGWADHEPVFVMANAPAGTSPPDEVWSRLRETVLARLRGAALCDPGDELVFERSPAELATQFPGSRGSIYGMASNSPLAAFRRPPNRVRGVRGLYLASGSAHPGGGVPLCLLSGHAAARALLADRGIKAPPETAWR
jgi:1-hydroxycarotenoid 3,4-desaturase